MSPLQRRFERFRSNCRVVNPLPKYLQVRLIDQRRARVLAGRNFQGENYAGGDDVLSGVDALNTAMQGVLPRVASWAGRLKLPRGQSRRLPRVRKPASPDDATRDLRDSQPNESETDPDAHELLSPNMLLGRRDRTNDKL